MGSKQQNILRHKLRMLLPQHLSGMHQDYRPDFMKNPKTKNNLEIDLYLCSFHIGVEFQGDVHFKYIRRYKNNPDKSRTHDMLKQKMVKDMRKFCLIEVFPDDLNGDFLSNFINRIDNSMIYYLNRGVAHKYYILERLKRIIFGNCGYVYKNRSPNDFRKAYRKNKELNILEKCYKLIDEDNLEFKGFLF